METQILEPGSATGTAAPESNARSTQLVVEAPAEPRPLTRAENSKAAVRNQVLVAAAWGIMILASILPEVIALEILHAPQALPVITWGRNIALALVVALCAAWEPLRKLWKFPAILLVFTLAQQGMTALSGTGVWREALSNIGD